jgi:hypothetical protein
MNLEVSAKFSFDKNSCDCQEKAFLPPTPKEY